jgi:hypothetical protein
MLWRGSTMTLAVVAGWPWGHIRSAFPLPKFEQAVILASDSRFVKNKAGADDVRKKVYWRSQHAAMVFAGDVLSAEEAVRRLRQYFRRQTDPSADCSEDLSRIIRDAHKSELSRHNRLLGKNTKNWPLHVLIGFCSLQGFAWGVRIMSDSPVPYAPLAFEGVMTIGDPEAGKIIHEVLAKIEDQRFAENNLDPDQANWGLDISIAMTSAIEKSAGRSTVGGKVQLMVIRKGEIGQKHFGRIRWDGPPERSAWQHLVKDGPPAGAEQITIPLEVTRPLRMPRDARIRGRASHGGDVADPPAIRLSGLVEGSSELALLAGEVATVLNDGPTFCSNRLWRAKFQTRLEQILSMVDAPDGRSSDALAIATKSIRSMLPPCRHSGRCG